MNVLAFDTSSAVLSVTLLIDAEAGTETAARPRALHTVRDTGLNHAEHLAPAVSTLLSDGGIPVSDLDLVACADGPGSFTGLRIGMATAKGFAAARGLPVRAVPTLDIWGELYRYWPGIVVPAIDARKGRFYAAAYTGGRRLTADLDEAAASIVARARQLGEADARDILVCGPDAGAFARAAEDGVLTVLPATDLIPSCALARLGLLQYARDGETPSSAGPTYVRKSDAELGR